MPVAIVIGKTDGGSIIIDYGVIEEVGNTMYTDDDLPYIRVSGSTFENLNHGRNITHLSIVEDKYHSTGIVSMTDVEDSTADAKQYPYFDGHGAVLNAEAFPGEIYFTGNTIKNNMYFIRDVFPSYRSK